MAGIVLGIVLGIILGLATYFSLISPLGQIWAAILAIVVLVLEAGTPYFPTRRP